MKITKYFWALRAMIYKIQFKKVGNYSYIGKPLIIEGKKNIEIGNRVRIYPGARFETHGQGSGICIMDNVSIGQNLHVVSSGSNLIIGTKTTISGNVFITNSEHNYQKIGVHIMEQNLNCKETKIGENCFIGYGAVILAGTTLGSQCIIGSNSVVHGDFPDYCVIAGAPARIIKLYNPASGIWEKV